MKLLKFFLLSLPQRRISKRSTPFFWKKFKEQLQWAGSTSGRFPIKPLKGNWEKRGEKFDECAEVAPNSFDGQTTIDKVYI